MLSLDLCMKSFNNYPWSLENLRVARHPSELEEDDCYYLYIDYKMRGLGYENTETYRKICSSGCGCGKGRIGV